MTQGTSDMERFVRKHIVWYKTLILVVNGVLFEKKTQEEFDSSKNRRLSLALLFPYAYT